MKRKPVRILSLAAGLVALAAAGVYASAFFAIVTPDNFMSLGFVEKTAGDASVNFVSGPATPPSGLGSLELQVGQAGKGAALRLETGWNNMPLQEIVVRYSTYVPAGLHCGSGYYDKDGYDRDHRSDSDSDDRSDRGDRKNSKAVYLTMHIDTNNDGMADDMLIFNPAFNGKIQCDTWQEWPATTGLWYSMKGGTFAAPGRPLAHYAYVHPGAKVVTDAVNGKGISLAAGFGGKDWKGFLGHADALAISDPRPNCQCADGNQICLAGPAGFYDFEPF